MRRAAASIVMLVAAAAWAGDAEDKALILAVPESPTDVAAKIDEVTTEILAATGQGMEYGGPKIDALAKLGRPAVGEFVRILGDFYGEEQRAVYVAATHAWVRIATKDDVPVVAALVRTGHAHAAFALRDVKTPEASVVIADAVERGLDHALCYAIEARGADERVGRALADFIASQADDVFASLVGLAAQAAGRAGAPEAVTPIKSFAAKTKDASVRARCFVGLARLGDADGVEGLIASIEKPGDPGTAALVGQTLNETSRRADFKGDFDVQARQWRGNFAEAAKAYRAWWTAAKATAKFDAAKRRWVF